MMKLFVIACVLGAASCAHLHADLHAVAAAPIALHTGASSQYRSQDVSVHRLFIFSSSLNRALSTMNEDNVSSALDHLF